MICRQRLIPFVREQTRIRVTVDYGYDRHSVSITDATWAWIERGQPVVVECQGLPVEGVIEGDRWAFNHGAVGAVHVSTDEGREVFDGLLGDAEVDVRGEYPRPPVVTMGALLSQKGQKSGSVKTTTKNPET